MALPGYPIKVYAKASSATPVGGDEVDGMNDATYNEMAELLEITDFKSGGSAAWKIRMVGLNDGDVNLAGDFEPSDAPQQLLRTSKRTGATVWISIYFAPSATTGLLKGYQVPCLVEKFDVKDSIGGKTETSFALKFNGAPTDVLAP